MPKEKMNIHDAQQHARRWVKDLRAAEHLEKVCDAVADAEARIGGAKKAVADAYAEVGALEERKVELQEENLALKDANEDIKIVAGHLSETFVSYKKQTDEEMAKIKQSLEDEAAAYRGAVSSMSIRKEEFAVELKLLRAEKEKIEHVIEAFRGASAKNQESEK